MEIPDDWRASKASKGGAKPPAPDDAAPSPGRIKRALKKIWRFVALLLVVGLAWAAWAAVAFYDFRSGLQSGDPVTLERRVDWSSVRQSLREDLQAGSQGGDHNVDAEVSRQDIVKLLRTAKLEDGGGATAAGADGGPAPVFGWHQVRYAFFSGGPFAFRVDIAADGDKLQRPLILLFKWMGDWQLTRVFLPTAAAPAAPQTAQSPPPAAAPTPPGAERVVLYEEDPKDPNGKRYTGSVVWRTERLPPTIGGESALAVVAKVSIPSRPLGMTLTIRRNLDKTLPASHIVDVKFDLPASASSGEVTDVAGIMMKPNEEAAGQSLAATRAKVSSNIFLVGLSAIDQDVKHNMEALKDRPWVGIPFVYSNHSRALLAIEKGKTGTSSLAEAMAQWSAAASGADRDGAGDKAKADNDKATKP